MSLRECVSRLKDDTLESLAKEEASRMHLAGDKALTASIPGFVHEMSLDRLLEV